MGCIGKMAMILVAAAAGGCARRTLEIDSQPQGALVFLNGSEVGRTPLSHDFEFYGDYDVVLRLDGYETLKTHANIKPPMHMWPPFDLLSELFGAHDRHHWTFRMIPAEQARDEPEDLLRRAEQLKGELRSSRYTRWPATRPATMRAGP